MQENVQYKPRDGKYNVETRNAIVIRTRANPEGMQREGERERERERTEKKTEENKEVDTYENERDVTTPGKRRCHAVITRR